MPCFVFIDLQSETRCAHSNLQTALSANLKQQKITAKKNVNTLNEVQQHTIMSQNIGFLQRVMKHICVQRRVSYFMASADILSRWHFAFIDCHANKMPFLRVSLSLS